MFTTNKPNVVHKKDKCDVLGMDTVNVVILFEDVLIIVQILLFYTNYIL